MLLWYANKIHRKWDRWGSDQCLWLSCQLDCSSSAGRIHLNNKY